VRTLADRASYEEEIKKSRFFARAAPVATVEEAMDFLGEISEAKATHNCWAYRVGEEYRFSDDGEPAGTAGRPIHGAIERLSLDGVMVVVTRYFGGIKLGAGGLARAYGGVAASCLRAARTREVRSFVTLDIEHRFEHIGQVQALVDRHDAQRLGETYTEEGVVLTVRLDGTAAEPCEEAIREATRGSAKVEPKS